MKKSKNKVRDRIDEKIGDLSFVNKDAVILILKDLLVEPDTQELIKQWWGKKTNYYIATYRDCNNIRQIFASRESFDTQYVVIENTNDVQRLLSIRASLKAKYTGLNASIKMIEKQITEVSGQTVLEFEHSETEKAGGL